MRPPITIEELRVRLQHAVIRGFMRANATVARRRQDPPDKVSLAPGETWGTHVNRTKRLICVDRYPGTTLASGRLG